MYRQQQAEKQAVPKRIFGGCQQPRLRHVPLCCVSWVSRRLAPCASFCGTGPREDSNRGRLWACQHRLRADPGKRPHAATRRSTERCHLCNARQQESSDNSILEKQGGGDLLRHPSIVQPLPAHTNRRSVHDDAIALQVGPQPRLRMLVLLVVTGQGALVLVCTLQAALNAGQEVEVVVNAAGGGEVATLNEGGGVALAIALGPLLMALVARKGACAHRVSGTAVLGRVAVAARRRAVSRTLYVTRQAVFARLRNLRQNCGCELTRCCTSR